MKPHIHFISHIPFSSLPTPGTHQSAFSLCGFTCKYFIQMESYNRWPLTSGFFHLQCFKLPCCSVYQLYHCFLWWNITSLHRYTTFCLSIHHLMDTWAISLFVICMWAFLWTSVYSSWGATPRSGIPGPYSRSILNPPRSCPTAFP